MISLLSIVTGALFRRWWGGWFSPIHWVKLPLGFILPAILAYGGSHNFAIAGVIGLCCGFAFLNPFHGEGMNMGRGYPANLSVRDSFLIMGGSYSVYFVSMAAILFILTNSYAAFLVLLAGPLIPCGYWLAYWLWDTIKIKPFGEYPTGNVFVDGAGAIGELFLGAIVFLTAYLGGCGVGM